MRVSAFATVGVLVAVSGIVGTGAAEPESMIAEVFAAFDARPVSCPASVEQSLEEGQTARCASIEARFSQFRKRWRRFVKERDDLAIVEVADWARSGPHWNRSRYEANGIPLTLAFSESNSGVMLTYGVPMPMCAEKTAEELGLPFAGTDGIPALKLAGTSKVSINSPFGGAAKVEVRLKIKIDRSGKPTVLCVLSAKPEGYKVEDEVIRSVEGWRYEPPTRDGEPLDVASTVFFGW